MKPSQKTDFGSSSRRGRVSLRCWMTRRFLIFKGGPKTAGILEYFEDFKRGTNKEIGPKDFSRTAG
jgi:hypothetical protein